MTAQLAMGKQKSKEEKAALSALPAELIDHILSFCDPSDLRVICSLSKVLYLRSLPFLYRDFNQVIWSDVIELNRSIQHGSGPASMDQKAVGKLIAESLQKIAVKNGTKFDTNREETFVLEEIKRCLIQITGNAKHLKRLAWHVLLFHIDLNPLYKALQTSNLQELSLREDAYQGGSKIYAEDSELWSLTTLARLEIEFPHVYHDYNDTLITRIANLIKKSGNLRHLQIKIKGERDEEEDDDDDDFYEPPLDLVGDDLFQLEEISQMESLHLEGVITENKETLIGFFNRIKSLKSLRLLQAQFRDGSFAQSPGLLQLAQSSWLKGTPILPLIKEIAVEDYLLKEVLSICSPSVLREVALRLPNSGSSDDDILVRDGCLDAIARCASLLELELLLYGEADTRNRCHVVAALQRIPISVERLALRFPNEPSRLKFEHVEEDLCYLAPFHRLSNLKMVNLPWSAVLYYESSSDREEFIYTANGPHMNTVHQDRAIALTVKLAKIVPTLEYVMFQGSHNRNTNDRPAWAIDWNEKADDHLRWTLKIDRKVKKTPKKSAGTNKKNKKKTKGKGKIEKVVEAANQVEEKETIEVSVMSSSCICTNCFKKESKNFKDCGKDDPEIEAYSDEYEDMFDPTDHPGYFDSYAEYAVYQEMHRYRGSDFGDYDDDIWT